MRMDDICQRLITILTRYRAKTGHVLYPLVQLIRHSGASVQWRCIPKPQRMVMLTEEDSAELDGLICTLYDMGLPWRLRYYIELLEERIHMIKLGL
jgi:hypothetical protein